MVLPIFINKRWVFPKNHQYKPSKKPCKKCDIPTKSIVGIKRQRQSSFYDNDQYDYDDLYTGVYIDIAMGDFSNGFKSSYTDDLDDIVNKLELVSLKKKRILPFTPAENNMTLLVNRMVTIHL